MGLMADTTNERNKVDTLTRSPNTISIWQQNVNRSSTCQHDLISSVVLAGKGVDIVALQEPSISKFGTTVASRDWILIYPSTHGTEPHNTRSIILIRSNILTEQWKQVDYPSGDVTIMQLSGSWGELTLFNIYNDCETNDTIIQLETFTQAVTDLSVTLAHKVGLGLKDLQKRGQRILAEKNAEKAEENTWIG